MKTVIAKIRGISPYSQSKNYEVEKADHGKESARDYEGRTWRERMHYTPEGEVFIPPMALKNCLAECAKFLSERIPGKGKATWTKHFEAGVLVLEPAMLGIQKDDVEGVWYFLPSDGVRGSGRRVWKCMPEIKEDWETTATFYILDETINEETFRHHLDEAGKFIGLGRFRPRNSGFFGRFIVDDVQWDVKPEPVRKAA